MQGQGETHCHIYVTSVKTCCKTLTYVICYSQGINECVVPASPVGDTLRAGPPKVFGTLRDYLQITCTAHTTWKQFGMSPTLG